MDSNEQFYIFLVRPTRYDDDGYPIHWWPSKIPSNTLACMLGLALDCRDRSILGEHVEIVVEVLDESSQPFKPEEQLANLKKRGARGLLALVGVQTNQFPRAIDIAQPFLNQGLPVCIGGFHVSGILSMFSEPTPEIAQAMEQGISIFAGEAEERRFDQVVIDASKGQLQRLYDYTNQLPCVSDQPIPHYTPEMIGQSYPQFASIDLSRGCPFKCSFCCIINVQGRKNRFRSVDDLEKAVRRNFQAGAKFMFITDDNFARNKNWEVFLDRLIALRGEGIRMSFYIQVDTLSHRVPNFIDKCAAAGVTNVFMGIENINPDNLAAMGKKQNRISEYREVLMAWKRHPVLLWGSYIVGMANDTRESILRDIEIIKRELPIDALNMWILTPLPGSVDHKRLCDQGVWMDPDLNKYDLAHRVTHHPKMTDAELDQVYGEALNTFYSPDHMITILRRMFALGSDKRLTTVLHLTFFGVTQKIFNIRSYDLGLARKKSRKSRRPGLPLENPISFYTKLFIQTVWPVIVSLFAYGKLRRKMMQIEKDPNRMSYMDDAIKPVSNEDLDKLSIFKETMGGPEFVQKLNDKRNKKSSTL